MNDYSWLDSRKKWYGIYVSNNGKDYNSGLNNETIRLEVEVEEGEQFVNYLRF
jgi:hypothetical protein